MSDSRSYFVFDTGIPLFTHFAKFINKSTLEDLADAVRYLTQTSNDLSIYEIISLVNDYNFSGTLDTTRTYTPSVLNSVYYMIETQHLIELANIIRDKLQITDELSIEDMITYIYQMTSH